MTPAFVFGYGSLAQREGTPCTLRDHARSWGVAMDNRRTIPGYKIYLDPETGARPEIYVAYLDIEPTAGAAVAGVAFAAPDLAALDRRERSYHRRDVTALVDADLGGPVYAYVGRAESRARLAAGRAAGTAVVASHYLENVRAGFDAYGALAAFEATTAPLDLPLRDLRRVDLKRSSIGQRRQRSA
jgi:cation transport regulator ChaC